MQLLISRFDASRLSRGLDLAIRMSLGQWEEIEYVLHMSEPVLEDADANFETMHDIRDLALAEKHRLLGLSANANHGIFSDKVADVTRELFTLKKILDAAIPLRDESSQESELSVGLTSALIAHDTQLSRGARAVTGRSVAYQEDCTHLMIGKHGHVIRMAKGMCRDEPNEDGVWVLIDLPDTMPLEGLVALCQRAYDMSQALISRQRYAVLGLAPLEAWLLSDESPSIHAIPIEERMALVAKLVPLVERIMAN